MKNSISAHSLGYKRFQSPRAEPLGELRVLLFDEEQYHRERALGKEVRGEPGPKRAQALCLRDGGEGVPRAAVSRLLAGFLLFNRGAMRAISFEHLGKHNTVAYDSYSLVC